MNWGDFAAAKPELADYGRQRLENRVAYLATVRSDGSPRVHPVTPIFVNSRLFLYMEPTSPKRHDLLRDSRYSMHCGVEDNSGGSGEFLLRGRAVEIEDAVTRKLVFEHAQSTGHNPLERYVLFEFGVDEVMTTVYESDRAKRTRWKAV